MFEKVPVQVKGIQPGTPADGFVARKWTQWSRGSGAIPTEEFPFEGGVVGAKEPSMSGLEEEVQVLGEGGTMGHGPIGDTVASVFLGGNGCLDAAQSGLGFKDSLFQQ
jgi:hypothetical protein